MTRIWPLRLSVFLVLLLTITVGNAHALDYPRQVIKVVVTGLGQLLMAIISAAFGALEGGRESDRRALKLKSRAPDDSGG